MELTGGCLCGAVRFRVTAEPLAAYYCHCTICQKNGGGPFMVGATVPIEGFTFTQGEPNKDNPKLADFSLGCLDDPNAIQTQFHIFTSTQVSWCEIAGGLPRHAKREPDLAEQWSELEGLKPLG
jgi:hypothetical protein